MQQEKSADRSAPFYILIAGILWGSMGLFVRRLGSGGMGLSSVEIVQMRCIVAGVVLFFYMLFGNRAALSIRLRDLWCFLGTGLCSIVFFNICYFTTIQLTSLSVAAVLLYTAPAFVIVLSALLFGEAVTKRKTAALFLTFLGCVCVSGLLRGGGAMTPAGFLVGLGAGIGYALYSIFSRFALERGYGSMTISFYTFLIASLGTIPFVSVKNVGGVLAQGLPAAGFILLFGVVTTVIPYLTYTRGLQGVENGQASIIASIEPVVASLLGILVFREILHPDEVLGIVLILGAILISNRREKVQSAAAAKWK